MTRNAIPDVNPAHAVFRLDSQDKIFGDLSAGHHMKIKRYAHRTFDTHHSTHIQNLWNNERVISRNQGPDADPFKYVGT